MTPEEFRESAARAIESRINAINATEYESKPWPEELGVEPNGDEEVVGLLKAAAIVRAHPAAPPWIPVAERLPEDRQAVAFVVAKDNAGIAPGRVLGGRYDAGPFGGFGIPGLGGIYASHWTPLPEPPEPAPVSLPIDGPETR